MNEYDKQAEKFLKDTETEFKAEFLKNGFHFQDDKEQRDIYLITLKRGEREFKFNFGQSLAESGLRLFLDKENTKRTRHKSFIIPDGLREKQEKFNQEHNRNIFKSSLIKRWFEYEHFSLNGLYWDCEKVPSAYDVLSSLTSYDVGGFKDFCGDFGYDEDSIKAEKTYKAVLEEWKNIKMLYSDKEILKLQEIQ